MRFPDHMLHCVAFIGYLDEQGAEHFAGTGFFVQIMDATEPASPVALSYLVTVKHVAARVRHKAQPFAEYISLFNGTAERLWLSEVRWHYHDSDSVDLAACYFPKQFGQSVALAEDNFMRREDFKKFGIGIGDEVFSVSLFGLRGRKFTKAPIARIGSLAMIPSEPVPTADFGEMEAYLIEARSIGGFSGAPVFVRESVQLPEVQFEDPDHHPARPQAVGNFTLLGVVHGHWDLAEGAFNDELPESASEGDVLAGRGVNMGIALVVPSDKIDEILESEEFLREKAALIASIRAARRSDLPRVTLD